MLESLISFCKRKGFVFQSGEIYGGIQGIYDYGPLGIELKNNLKSSWWRSIVYEREDVEGIESSIITNKDILLSSGHESCFVDEMVDCKDCKKRFRIEDSKKCIYCNSNNLTENKKFNLMFKTNFGSVEGKSYVYLRPETAQGIFVNFKNVLNTTGKKIPFGIAQIGKAFRNEITPKNFLFRLREFELMEMEFFVDSKEDKYWYDFWIENRFEWWKKQGLNGEKLKLYIQTKEELAHYSKYATDILYKFDHGWSELEGIANRSNNDLKAHSTYSNFEYVDNKGNRFVPSVIEPSCGIDRGILAILSSAYENKNERVVLKLAKHLSPIKVAIIPLAKNKLDIYNKSREIFESLKFIGKIKFEDCNVGKAYKRNDEIGTPLCVTIDYESLNDDCVTIRERDSMKQIRISINNLSKYILDFFYTN